MLRDRYEPLNLFALVPALGLEMEPVLLRLDALLEDDALFQVVRADLAQRYPRTLTDGRPSTPVEVVVRLLVVKHLYGWSYKQTEHFVSDSLVLGQFCRLYLQPAPDATTLLRWANLIQPVTLHSFLDHVVELARSLQVTRGRKLRIDGTVVETNIHHPTDSTLLYDGVRVLGRALHQARQVIQEGAALGAALFRDRTRSAKRQMKRIMETARQRGDAAADRMRTAYGRLLDVARASVQQAAQVAAALQQQADVAGQRLAEHFATFRSRVEQVISQTQRRVLEGEAVPAGEKLVSLFEPHTAIIRKGKPGKPVEFGRDVWLDEVDGGIISRYEVLPGNPPDAEQLRPSLEHHRRVFKKPPDLVVGDRGIHSASNEAYATAMGVKQVVLPKPGSKSAKRIAYEQQRWFRRGRDWRAGIEGRISGLKRRHKLNRCRYHGDAGMERWVGWGVIAHDLRKIAQATAA
ncbi:MAG: ISNCY family transposase [Actinomycetota bacterium]|nr:ISNCY family transposase [Actinomycetota bacterium]